MPETIKEKYLRCVDYNKDKSNPKPPRKATNAERMMMYGLFKRINYGVTTGKGSV